MSNALHIPMRMCAVTREKLPKKELLRFVLSDGEVVLDKGERVRGRGLNMKPDLEVFDLGIKKRIFERTFSVNLGSEKLAKLKKEVDDYMNLKFREKTVVRVKKEELDKLKSS